MIRRILIAIAAIVLVVIALSGYVALRLRPELRGLEATLRSPADATVEDIGGARERMDNAVGVLESFPAQILRLVPIARQNLDAVRATLTAADPALEAGAELRSLLDDVRDESVLSRGRVDLPTLDRLKGPLARAETALRGLEQTLAQHRRGWLLPPVWDRVDELWERTTEYRASVQKAARVAPVLPSLLGADGRRDYVVLLMNNAELRGAGGIVSGIGSLTADQGRISLGPFAYYADVARRTPLRTVPAPPAYERRFTRVGANTTVWANVGYSPDIPDVALVGARLFHASTGRTVDGTIIADARGYTALLPPRADVSLPRGGEIPAARIPEYAYNRQYRDFEGGDPARRESLVDLGADAFGSFIGSGSVSIDALERAGEAVLGGHIRAVSLHPAERDALIDAGIAGDLARPSGDAVLVAVQNLGADKLDYWVDRDVDHLCDITTAPARCVTRVTLSNIAPRGLTEYVAPRPNARTKEYLEIYVPAEADVSHVSIDGAPADHFDEEMAGLLSVGMDVEVERGHAVTATVGYYLPFSGDEYSVVATPQPLSRDADISLGIRAPEDWVIEGPDGEDREVKSFRGRFDRVLRFRAYPEERTGIPGWWESLTS